MKIGDTVRYLNAVGGGIVTRIDGDMVYVDDDGFETPVLKRECVVVGTAPSTASPTTPAQPAAASKLSTPEPAPKPRPVPVVEVAGGDKLNIVLGFEASDIKALSRSTFDAVFINDSNYWLFVVISSRSVDAHQWTHRYDGLIEPNMQEFLFELTAAELSDYERICVQVSAFKRGRPFEAKAPVAVSLKVDTTKFAKFHCFRPNRYFDTPVIAYDICTNDLPPCEPTYTPESLAGAMQRKQADVAAAGVKRQSEPQRKGEIIEVDLHASALFDSIDGLEPADILNCQIDRFTEVMKAHLRHPGTKIVFIHGKGEGVLRQAIMKELTHRFKGHDVQDASFREYGFGATQVTIRAVNAAHAERPKNKRR